MGKIVSITTISAYAVLVISIILTCVELSHSCHRRVEYHHYYKKRPHKAHGGGYGGGPHQSHGGGPHQSHGGPHHGHGGGYGGGGHHGGKAHGGGYVGGGHRGKGHGGGYGGGHHAKGHGGGHGYGGGHHSQGHGGGHPAHGGYGHMSGHGHHGGVYGHSGDGHKGYGSGHDQGGYGGDHQEHGGYGEGHHEHGGYQGGDGYGHGHGQNAYGHGHDEGYGPSGGGYGHDDGGAGHGQAYGHGKGHQDSGQKGRRYKYQMYESTHYNDKGGHQPTHGYAPSAPHYMQKGNGYGYSGPYPNTEYSAPVETSVDAPTGPSPSYYDGAVDDDSPPTLLDAADTADLIRNAIDTKENEVVHQHRPISNFAGGHMSDSSHSNSDYNSVDVLPTIPTMKISASGNSRDETLPETKVNPTIGNFDLNLNYNSDLPVPFRRNLFESSNERRKKISSKYRGNLNDFGPTSYSTLSQGDDSNASQSQSQKILTGGPGPDYLENDTGDVSGTTIHEIVKEGGGGPDESDKMNF